MRAISAAGLIAALFLAYLFSLSSLTEGRAQAVLLSKFRSSLSLLDGQSSEPPQGSPVGLLEIPAAGVQKMIVQGVGADQTEMGPGHDPATPLPGQVSNVVIVGRRSTFGAPFRYLDRLALGDTIVVLTRQGRFVYRVGWVGLQSLGSRAITQATPDARITLVTSDPVYRWSAERVVIGELVGEPLTASGNIALRPPGLRVGLTTGTNPLAGILVWAEAFIGSLVCALVLYRRRWSTVATFVCTTPVILTTMYLLFENVARALPPSA